MSPTVPLVFLAAFSETLIVSSVGGGIAFVMFKLLYLVLLRG